MRKRIEDFVNQNYHFDTIEDLENCVCEEFADIISGIYSDEEDDDYVTSFGVEDDDECIDVVFNVQSNGDTLEIVDFSIE
jgi:hypothetical protein